MARRRGGGINIEREEALARSVTRGTRYRIESGLKKWIDVMEYDMTNEDVYMESLSEEDKIDEIIVFINRIYLRGERDGQLSTSVSLVKSAFELAGVSSTVFDNGLVCRAKKGGRRSTEEARECSAGGAKREKFPMPLDIILDSKSSFWVQGKDSQVPDRVYGLSLRSEGAFAFSEGNERGVELEDLRLLAPAKGRIIFENSFRQSLDHMDVWTRALQLLH
eukprot:gene6596-13356_t